MKVYNELASLIIARNNCITKNNSEWQGKREDSMSAIINQYLPSGSGFDCDFTINLQRSTGNKLVLNSSYHLMNDNGYYDGWVDFEIIVTPCLSSGFDIKIKGKFSAIKRHYFDLKDYIADNVHEALNKDIILSKTKDGDTL